MVFQPRPVNTMISPRCVAQQNVKSCHGLFRLFRVVFRKLPPQLFAECSLLALTPEGSYMLHALPLLIPCFLLPGRFLLGLFGCGAPYHAKLIEPRMTNFYSPHIPPNNWR